MTYCRRSSAHGTVDPIVFAAPCCRNDRRKTVCYHLPTATASARRDGHGVSERERADQMVTSPPVETAIAAATWQAVARTRRIAQVVLGLLFILGIVGLLYWGREALPPFFLGLIVAYMLLPPVRRVERTLPHGKLWQTTAPPDRRRGRLLSVRCW